MKNDGTYRGSIATASWNNRTTTRRIRREERKSDRPRFNNKPAPLGTLPEKREPMLVSVVG
jgi:hypothetical protein